MKFDKQLPPVSSLSFRSFRESGSIIERIAAVAEAMPHAIALRQNTHQITYSALMAAADELAVELVEHGAGQDVPIGICVERSIERVIAMLAVLRAGSAFLPLDPDWPGERLCRVLDDAAAPIVIAASDRAKKLAASSRVVLGSARSARRGVGGSCAAGIKRDSLAYIIYTSGSSGEPKGVEITHRNLANLVDWHRDAFGITPQDRASWVAGLAFDASVWELFPYLAVGATIHLPDERVRASYEELQRWLVGEAISVAFVPTPLAETMITIDWPAETVLRTFLTGGDALHVWPKPGLPFQVINNYGPSECTVVATSGIVGPRGVARGLPTIGRPIANTVVEILDETGRRVGTGEIGEIYIAGNSVGRGYRHLPSQTVDRFVTIALTDGAAQRYFRTGDLGCWTAEGEIVFHGRCDSQIKLRGHRIEPDEISATLSRHPLVAQSAVVAAGEGSDKHLVAYIVPPADTVPHGGDLRDFLAASLPHYMLPAVYVRISALPITANGKLNRSALPMPTAANTLSSTLYRAPTSAVESRIAALVEELLSVRGVGIDDNFFMLGGHSLLGTQLVLRLRDTFGAELTLRDLFDAQTIQNLAAKVEEAVTSMVVGMSEEELQERLVH
jgi:amino acid adenylation domain-containing protein